MVGEACEEIVKNEIAPLVMNGDVALFLGAGFSINTPCLNNKGVPSTGELINRICSAAGFSEEQSEGVDLATAFQVGADDVDNFENFLVENFTVKTIGRWQGDLLRYWWRVVFTTNIDTILDKAVSMIRHNKDYPDYKLYNYRDRCPVMRIPTEPPVVNLHGSIARLGDGFVFDSLSYAVNTIRATDWMTEAALQITHGHCLFIGSKFKESDIEAVIRKRADWDKKKRGYKNWIVLLDVNEVERRAYEKRGFVVIEASAEDFLENLYSNLKYVSPQKFIRRKIPHLIDSDDNSAVAWFSSCFDHVPLELEKAHQRNGVKAAFFMGAMPDWYYIVNVIPARFSFVDDVVNKVEEFNKSSEKACVISITGPLASGKSTVGMQALAELTIANNGVYHYNSTAGFDVQKCWSVIKDSKGLLVIYIDSASEHYYAVNDLVDRVNSLSTSCKLCFIIEERSRLYQRNKRHLHSVPPAQLYDLNITRLDHTNAGKLLEKADSLGVNFEKLNGLNNDQKVGKIVDFDKGYRGDLLATLYDLSSKKSYKEKLNEEYREIDNPKAKEIFNAIALVTSCRLFMPLNYLSQSCSLGVPELLDILDGDLQGKICARGDTCEYAVRHHSIADYYLNESIQKGELKDIIINLMRTLSSKFDISDIPKHPISYRIYKKIMSYHFLVETLFFRGKDIRYAREIYSACQELFSRDAIFWLQYGRFFESQNELDDAIICLRKGFALYDSFQIRHSLGQVLLHRYRQQGMEDEDEYKEGLALLKREVLERGSSDPYPSNALGKELVEILRQDSSRDDVREELTVLINNGLKVFADDPVFMNMFGKAVEAGCLPNGQSN